MTTSKDLRATITSKDTPTELLQLTSRQIVNELFRRGVGVDELCNEIGVSQDMLWRMLSVPGNTIKQ
jgi:hypothetical protein